MAAKGIFFFESKAPWPLPSPSRSWFGEARGGWGARNREATQAIIFSKFQKFGLGL